MNLALPYAPAEAEAEMTAAERAFIGYVEGIYAATRGAGHAE